MLPTQQRLPTNGPSP